MSQVYYVLTRIRGYRPAAVLLHTAETDAVLIDTAGDLGVACLQLPAPAVLRQSLRSVWDLVSTVKVFFVTKEAIKALRLAPTFCRRMSTEGVLCQVDTEHLASLTLGMYATQQQVLDRIRHEAKPLLTSARQVLAARFESLGIRDGHAKVLAVEHHLQQTSRLNIHFDAQSGIVMAGSRVAVMEVWLHDAQYRSGHETGNFGGNKNQDTRILWENAIWRSAYALGNGVDASQVPKYAGLNILPQAGGLDDPPGEFAFGDCYLQLKQHMLQRSSFCVGDSGSVVEAALALGVPCELQLATIDTILVALQSDEFELDDEALCKLVAVLTTALPLPQFEYLIEAQVHTSIMLAEDIESLQLPAKYRIAPQAAGHIFRANLQAQRLCEKFGWRLCYY